MSEPKNDIVKGVKLMAISLPLMILGPVVLSIGFRSVNDGNYIWKSIGIIFLFAAIIIAFMGIKTILNGLFHKNEN